MGERIAARIDHHGECWIWSGTYAADGYPVFTSASGNISIIPALWVQENGPVPNGMVLTCTHTRTGPDVCVNPAHYRPRPAGRELATMCKWGHDLTDPQNLWVGKTGVRYCIACFARRREHSGDKPRRRNRT